MRPISRMNYLASLGLILLLGCSAVTPPTSPTSSTPPTSPTSGDTHAPAEATPIAQSPEPQAGQAQVLPISAEADINGQIIQLEVARTQAQQSQGLMHRPPLPDDRGMLFVFDPPRFTRFWMRNTPSPLDMVFLREGEVLTIIDSAQPCEADPCPTYGPDTPTRIDQVIELRAGRAAELGLAVGDRVQIRFFD
ncbi:DUF192 domain-containing protein [Egbenema bharatensis]|uniref:DUF192 domain-containing protein n=1 Tax=Egbenema bharatensis TaxID=3463334 RepID=UPI003A8C70C1